MWPEEMRLKWERVHYAQLLGSCESIGYHRFGAIHLLPQDETIQYRSCKRCGLRDYTRIQIINGKLVESSLKPSTLSDDNKSTDKST